MQIQLSDHFTYKKLMRFTLPSILSMLFTSIYGVVDGFFVSNVVGESAFASINLIMPYLYIFSALGSVLGAGGGALVALLKGRARRPQPCPVIRPEPLIVKEASGIIGPGASFVYLYSLLF